MGNFTYELREDLAWVRFDSGSMNTFSSPAIADLEALVAELEAIHAKTPLKGVIMRGNKYGLGAGADIGELMSSTRADLEGLIDKGNEVLFSIDEGELPWLAVIEGYALGGIYELCLACDAIVATEKSTVGFPEIKLNIFPGLGGTQRMPRRSGLINAADPVKGDAGFSAILQGKNFRARAAEAIGMIDGVIPEGKDVEAFARTFLLETLPTLDRTPPADLADAESLRPMIMPVVEKATSGRPNPRAPYVAVEAMIKGAPLPLREAIKVERDAFIEVGSSAEGKAGMRFFFTQQQVQKLPKALAGKAGALGKVGVDGVDGYMGNAIGFLALEAGYEVVGHVPLPELAESVPGKFAAKYARAVKRGKLTEQQVEEKIASVEVTTEPASLADCDLVVEARMENKDIKAAFYEALGGVVKKGALVASNSSSMGPAVLTPFFAKGGGDATNFLNVHFFSPAEHPAMQLVEIVRGAETSDEAVATCHKFVRSIGKTPVILQDGSAGFLVNAGLAAYMAAAEEVYLEGTPIDAIDDAIRTTVLPMGPFELGDQVGIDILAGMLDVIAEEDPPKQEPLAWKMRQVERFGIKSGGGYFDYDGKSKKGPWEGLAELAGERGSKVASGEEIVERCMRALYRKARELCERGIVGSPEECDLAFVFGIGFAMHLGGPMFYGGQQGWDAG